MRVSFRCGSALQPSRLFLPLVLLTLATDPAFGQAPRVTAMFPPGLQRGTVSTLTLTGEHLDPSCRLIFSTGGIKVTGVEAAKEGNSLKVRCEVSEGARLGIHEMRVFGPKGASNARFLEIGTYKEREEAEPNDSPAHAMLLPEAPMMVSGRIAATDRDVYRVKVGAGETWAFRLETARLGSPLEGFLTLMDEAGHEIASAVQMPEGPPLLIHRFEKSGEVTVAVRDLRYRGGDDFLYCLTMGATSLVRYSLPLGVTRGKTTSVRWKGANLEKIPPTNVGFSKDDPSDRVTLSPMGENGPLPPMDLAVSDGPEWVLETPAPTRAQAMRLEGMPVAVSGVLSKPGEAAHFRFTAPKDGKVTLETFARRLGSRLDSFLSVVDPSGKEVGTNDDAEGKDSRLTLDLTPGAAYFAEVRDLPGGGGEDYFFRLALTASQEPDFTLRAFPDALNIGQGGTGVVRVYADRRNGFAGDIDVKLSDLPTGVAVRAGVLKAGMESLPITLTAAPGASMGASPFTVTGSSQVKGQDVRREARPVDSPQPPGMIPNAPPPLQFQLIGVGDAPPYTLRLEPETASLAPGGTVKLAVKVERKPETDTAKGEIALEVEGLPPGWTAESPVIPADKSEGEITLKVPAEASLQTLPLIVFGKIGEQRLPAPALWVSVEKGK